MQILNHNPLETPKKVLIANYSYQMTEAHWFMLKFTENNSKPFYKHYLERGRRKRQREGLSLRT